MKTVTPDQFKKVYGDAGLASFQIPVSAQEAQAASVSNDSMLNSILKDATNKYGQGLMNTYKNAGQDFVDAASSSKIEAGSMFTPPGSNVQVPRTELQAKVARVGEGALRATASGLNTIFAPITEGVKALAEAAADNPKINSWSKQHLQPLLTTVAGINKWMAENPEQAKNIESAITIASAVAGEKIGNTKIPRGTLSDTTAGVTSDVATVAKSAVPTVADAGVRIPTTQISSGIMNRVARLNPSDMTKFEAMSGKTPGQYLTETGNFGAPDKIIQNEALKFTQSKNMVDAELGKLPGLYQDGAISDMLGGLAEKVKNVSTDNVSPPYAEVVKTLGKKYQTEGLSMKEINTIKRLYEREVKLKYDKLISADKIEKATNIDSAVRNWQINKASELGFKNIQALNKQTQIAKFLIDKLGDKIVGQGALNSVNLSDWIVLSGGSPESVAGFLTKKFFSSKNVQAKIAEILNSGEPTRGIIKPDVAPTVENTLRQTFPQGTKLELPAGRSPVTENRVPIQARPESSIEPPAKKIFNQSMVKTVKKSSKKK